MGGPERDALELAKERALHFAAEFNAGHAAICVCRACKIIHQWQITDLATVTDRDADLLLLSDKILSDEADLRLSIIRVALSDLAEIE